MATDVKPQAPIQRTERIDPEANPVAYLLAKGWKPEGDPKAKTTTWLDPTKPQEVKSEMQVVAHRQLPNGTTTEVKQLVVTHPSWPYSRESAVSLQQDRDAKAVA